MNIIDGAVRLLLRCPINSSVTSRVRRESRQSCNHNEHVVFERLKINKWIEAEYFIDLWALQRSGVIGNAGSHGHTGLP